MPARVRLALALALTLALTGCARPDAPTCEEPFPLAVDAYPEVGNASLRVVQTAFWNCTGVTYALDDPCDARTGLMPVVTIDDAWHYPTFGGRTLVPREHVDCMVWGAGPPAREVAEPGYYVEQRYVWDGTYRPGGGAAVPVPPGSYTFFLRIGPFYDSATIEAPFELT